MHLSLEQRQFTPATSHCVPSPIQSAVMHLFSFPELDAHQRRMYAFITLVFFLTLGGYWLIRPMKMGVFAAFVGIEHEPQAKLGTLIILIPLLFGYNKLYSTIDNPKTLVMVVAMAYSLLFFFIAVSLIQHEDEINSGVPLEGRRLIGWLTYWTIESFGSVFVAMLWSVTASVSNGNTARSVYPAIVVFQQLGAVGGATLATFTELFGFPLLFCLQGLNVLVTAVLIRFAITIHERRMSFGRALDRSDARTEKPMPTGLLEGLRLIITRPYVLCVLVVSTFSEVAFTIMDFQMKVVARAEYTGAAQFASFMGRFGQATNTTSLLLALFGTQQLMKRCGLKVCLLTFPVCVGIVIVVVAIKPHLWMLFGGMVAIKALGYALNGPARELLYVRTSSDIKFKAKSWIDMFGTRGAKAMGSMVNNSLRHSMEALLRVGSVCSGGFVAVWLVAAVHVGHLHKEYELHDKVVE